MKRGSRKQTPQIYKGPDFESDQYGLAWRVEGSKEYYSIKDLAKWILELLKEFGLTMKDLRKVRYSEKNKDDVQTLGDIFGESNIYRYFRQDENYIVMPDDLLEKMPELIERCIKQKKLTVQENVAFEVKFAELCERIRSYRLESGLFETTITEWLERASLEKLLRFMDNIYALEITEEAWRFWQCYETLNTEKRREAELMLAEGTGMFPQYSRLVHIGTWIREKDLPIQHRVLTAKERCGDDEKKLKKAIVKIAMEHFQTYPDKVALSYRIWDILQYGIPENYCEWSVVLLYDRLCTPEGRRKAEDFVLSSVKEKDGLQEECPMETARHFADRYRELVEWYREMMEENFFAEDEENEQ